LDRLGVRWALIGGLAVSVRAEPRTTRDIDVAIAVENDRQGESIVRDLRARGYRYTPNGVLEQTKTGRLATVRLMSIGPRDVPAINIDLMFASSGIEPEIVAAATRLQPLVATRMATMPIATRAHLIALKVLAGRPQDVADAVALLSAASTDDLQQTREALDLISRRGYDRGKNLGLLFATLLEQVKEGGSP
jgi:hypothetical protein